MKFTKTYTQCVISNGNGNIKECALYWWASSKAGLTFRDGKIYSQLYAKMGSNFVRLDTKHKIAGRNNLRWLTHESNPRIVMLLFDAMPADDAGPAYEGDPIPMWEIGKGEWEGAEEK
jgi:hypothetical protein